jgi:hypothetical protein
VTRIASIALLLAACGDDDVAPPLDAGGSDAGNDAGPPPPPWPKELPPSSMLGPRRGLDIARVVIHLHSPLSHDACDGRGWEEGALANPECLEHFRDGLCRTHTDMAALTDHAPHVNEVSFEQALWLTGDEELVRNEDGDVYAAYMPCEDGHRVLLTVGSENELMPVNLRRHPGATTDPAMLEEIYDGSTPEALQMFRDAGALVLIAHTEQYPLETLRASDGIELYNIHANYDPRIRSEWLGRTDAEYLTRLLAFIDTRSALEPDLLFLGGFEENTADLDKWDTLLSEGVHMPAFAGCDAHENTFSGMTRDGERGDSYRRILRFYSNHVLVTDVTVEAFEEAFRASRLYVAFEAYGTPMGFDYVGEMGAETFEIGTTAPVGATLRVTRPALPSDHPSEPAPAIRMRILRSTAGGRTEVAAGTGETLEFVATEAGAYRAEVWIVPEHARPYLGREADSMIRDVPWVYANPIHVE